MKDIELQAERKAFEAWYEAYCMPSEADWFRRDVDDESEYHHAITADAWAAWQARAAVEADRAQRVSDDGFAVNFVVHAGLDKHKARECERIVRELLASTPAPAQQEPDWKDMYEKEKRRSAMWVAKYEKDIGPLEYAVPVAHQEPPQPVERKPMTDEIVRLAGVVLNEMPHPMTNWQSAAKKVCEAVAAIKEQT